MLRLFMKKQIIATLALILALVLSLGAIPEMFAVAEGNGETNQEVIDSADEADDSEIAYEDDSDGDDETVEIDETDEGDEEAEAITYAETEGDGDAASPADTGEEPETEPEDLEEPETEPQAESEPENPVESGLEAEAESEEPEQPQTITIAEFAELAEEIAYQGLSLPKEDEPPLSLSDINFPMSLEATDTDGNAIDVALDMWLGENYDLAVMGEYTFIAKLPAGYALDAGTSMPIITVFVVPSDLGVAPMAAQDATVTTFAQLQAAIASYADAAADMTITVGANFNITAILSIPANASGATLTITSDGTVRTLSRGYSETNTTNGLCIVNAGASLILENIIIDGNKGTYASNQSPLVYIIGNGAVRMESDAILRNNAAYDGGGVLLNNNATFTMSGGEISGNFAARYGGGISSLSSSATCILTGGAISDNTAVTDSGGVEVYCQTILDGVTITGNKSKTGGGVYLRTEALTIGDATVINYNTTTMEGSAANNLDINGRLITLGSGGNCSAPADGMDIGITHASTGEVTITSGTNAQTEYEKYFFSDVDTRGIICDGNVLKLVDAVSFSAATATPSGTLVYNGTEQTPEFTVTLADGTILTAGTDYILEVVGIPPEPVINAGLYPSIIRGVGYYSGRKIMLFTIDKAPLTVTAASPSTTYGDAAPVYTATISGFVNDEDESLVSGVPDFDCDYPQNSNAGSYTITPSIGTLDADNYSFDTFVNGTLTVDKAAGAAVSGTLAAKSTTTASITVGALTNKSATGQSVEYAIRTGTTAPANASAWQSGTKFTGLARNTTYYIFARTRESANYNSGAALRSAPIKTDSTESSSSESSNSSESNSAVESSSQAESSASEAVEESSEEPESSSEAEQVPPEINEASSAAESVSVAETSSTETSSGESTSETRESSDDRSAEAADTSESTTEQDASNESDSDRSDSDSDRKTESEPRTAAETLQVMSEKVGEVVSDMFSGARVPVGPAMDLQLNVDIGSAVYGREIMLTAKGLKPFTEVKMTVYSEPRILGIETADENGEATLQAVFPADLEQGAHTVIAEGIGTLDEPVQSVSMLKIDGQGIVTELLPPSQVLEPVNPGDKSLVRAMEAGKPLYDSARYPGTVAGATLAICLTGGGLAAMAGLRKPGKHNQNREERRNPDREGLGDKGFLWNILPFRQVSDNFSIASQNATAKLSFTLNRFVTDGVWSRAMFGSGGFLLWLSGLGLGAYASAQMGFKALPPDFNIVIVIVALGFLDAGAGFAAWLMIALLAVCTGNVTGISDMSTLLGMFTLFAALMTLSGSRPLRREYEPGGKFIFDRIMDYVIPTVYIMLASSAILNVINGLSGLELFSEENGRTIKLVSVLALWVRLALEDITINLFPRRYAQVYADAPIQQRLPLVLGAIALYITMFIMVSIPFFGFGAMLLCLLALDIVPSLLVYIEDKLPNFKFLNKWYPGAESTYASLVLTVVGIFLTLQLMTGITDYRQLSIAMIILAIPTAVAEIPSLFGREGYISKNGWARRIAEVGCWVLFAAISLDLIKLV